MSLIGHLAPKFAGKPEDVATEALSYILSRSDGARRKFSQHLEDRLSETAEVDLDDRMRFSSQRGSGEGAIPDLWGQAPGQRVLVEVKFWAGFTDRQTEGYSESLTGEDLGACVFLVPEERVENVIRKMDALFDEEADSDVAVSVTSWPAVLDAIESALHSSEEDHRHRVLEDLRQLRGLCERLEAEGFHPIRSDELGPDVARRQLDLRKLVEELREVLTTQKFDPWKVTSNMRRRTSVYRFKGELYGTTYFLGILYNQWKDLEDSPLWVKFREADSRRQRRIKEMLREEMTVLDHPKKARDILVPLELEFGVSRDGVLRHLKSQLTSIPAALSPLASR